MSFGEEKVLNYFLSSSGNFFMAFSNSSSLARTDPAAASDCVVESGTLRGSKGTLERLTMSPSSDVLSRLICASASLA